MKITGKKIIISGDILEIFEYEDKKFFYGDRKNSNQSGPRVSKKVADTSILRAKSRIRRLINSNTWKWQNDNGRKYHPIFLTLTFKENIQILSVAHKEFMKFIQRLNYFINKEKITTLKYLAVIEFQKRGAIHYHVIFFNLPFIKNVRELNDVWGLGMHNLEAIKDEKKLTIYITKYLTKNLDDERLFGRKKYFTSRGLYKPFNILNELMIEAIMLAVPESTLKVDKSRSSEFMGRYRYRLYSLDEEFIVNNLGLVREGQKMLKSAGKNNSSDI